MAENNLIDTCIYPPKKSCCNTREDRQFIELAGRGGGGGGVERMVACTKRGLLPEDEKTKKTRTPLF